MSTPSEISLPPFFFRVSNKPGNEKINFGPISPGVHMTVHFGSKSKKLDIHLTYEGVNKKYKTVIEIQHYTLYRLCVFFNNELLPEYFKLFDSRIKLGKLKKYNCFVQEFSESALSQFFSIKSKQNKIETKRQIPFEFIENMYKSPDEISNNIRAYGVYRLCRNNLKWNGFILNYPIQNKKNKSFIYISKRKQKMFLKLIMPKTIMFIKNHNKSLYNNLVALNPEFQIISESDSTINKDIKQLP